MTRFVLPSRYEDLDIAFRGRLLPNQQLLDIVKDSIRSISVSGGIRFLPILGKSGSGKTCASLEIGTHLPTTNVVLLSRKAVESGEALRKEIADRVRHAPSFDLYIYVVDQFEESVAEKGAIPTQFIEQLSLLDREAGRIGNSLFLWLTTNVDFHKSLVDATSRNRRILLSDSFGIDGPTPQDWPQIIEDTFEFHNRGQSLANCGILSSDLENAAIENDTIGKAIEVIGAEIGGRFTEIQDLSTYQVVMLWPVTDGNRITRIQSFTIPREGYRIEWNAWYRSLNTDDQKALPLKAYNRTRLYFDVRLVPIAVADLSPLCRELDDDDVKLHDSYLERFKQAHFCTIIDEKWNPDAYSPMRERDSKRAEDARLWYETVTTQPTKLSRRIAKILRSLGYDALHEKDIASPHGKIRADVLIQRPKSRQSNVIVELKAFSAENTMPSTIKEQIKITLRRHAQFAGFIEKQ